MAEMEEQAMDMNKLKDRRDIWWLFAALLFVVLMRSATMSGLYHDVDEAFYAASALHLFDPHYFAILLKGLSPPGIAFIYFLAFSVFGPSFVSVQLFALIFNLISVFLLYFLAKRLLAGENKFYYLLPLLYALFSVSEALQGHTANKELFLAPFEIGAIFCLGMAILRKREGLTYFSGLLLGAAFLIKQSSFAYFAAGAVFIMASGFISVDPPSRIFKRTFYFTAAFLLPLIFAWVFFVHGGGGESFVKNKVFLIASYVKNIGRIRHIYLAWTLGTIWKGLRFEVIVFGSLALFGLFHSLANFKRPERLFLLCWFIVSVSVISVSGFHFRHHFVEVLAPFAALALMGASDTYGRLCVFFSKNKILKIVCAIAGVFILVFPYIRMLAPFIKENKWAHSFLLTERYLRSKDKDRYVPLLLKESGDGARRFLVAQYVKGHTAKTDKILIWDDIDGGSIFLWSDRGSSFGLTIKPAVLPNTLNVPVALISSARRENYKKNQKTVMQKLSETQPAYIIIAKRYALRPNAPLSPDQQLASERAAFKEFFDYVDKNYNLETQLYDFQIFRRLR